MYTQILDREANLTIGNYGMAKDRIHFLGSSSSIYFSAVLFAMSPGHPFSSLEKLFLPFKIIAWHLVVSTFVVAGIGLLFLRRAPFGARAFIVGPDNRSPISNMILICFGGGVQLQPRRNFARYMLLMWIAMMLVLRNMYQGNLFVLLQKVLLHPIPNTLEEMTAGNYTFYAEPAAKQFFGDSVLKGRK